MSVEFKIDLKSVQAVKYSFRPKFKKELAEFVRQYPFDDVVSRAHFVLFRCPDLLIAPRRYRVHFLPADGPSHLSDSPVNMSPNSRVPAMMNRRRDKDGGGEESKDLSKWSREQRLGGKGLSLVAFSNAKSKRLDYNPSFISE